MIGGIIFGVIIPYIAVAICVCGIIYKIVYWANSPVPLKIPTTSGQAYSPLPFIKRTVYDRFDSPYTKWETVGRMFFEIFLFRSLIKNTRYYLDRHAQKDARWLWLFAILFHYSLLLVLLNHLKFFIQPIPEFIITLGNMLSFMGVFVPPIYVPGLLIVAALFLLWMRRIFLSRERTLSLPSDHFVLILLLAITISGNLMKYFFKVDLELVKELIMNLMTFNIAKAAAVANQINPMFYIHFLLVCFLIAYFPFSKLMHAGGIFFSPTRNMPNNNRAEVHVNPWNPPYKGITWEEYYQMYKDQLDEIAEQGYKVKPEL